MNDAIQSLGARRRLRGSGARRKHLDWESLEPFLSAIRAMAELYDNGEASREKAALSAARENRPAYWSSARYHNQAAMLLAHYANTDGLAASLRQWADDAYPSSARHTAFLLSTLVPLNAAAAGELHAAIARHRLEAA